MDFIKTMLELVGGVSAIVCTTIAICKGIFEKYICAEIEKSAEKELEKAKTSFARSFSAYELLLKKEFAYYESIDKLYATLIVDVHDFKSYSIEELPIDIDLKRNNVKEITIRILTTMMELKNLNLIYQVYVPFDIFSITADVVSAIQNDCELVEKTAINVFEGKNCDEEALDNFVNLVTKTIMQSNILIKHRLNQLSK